MSAVWLDYVYNMVDGKVCTDCAIYSLAPPHGVWAAFPGGGFTCVKAHEFAPLVSKERSSLFIHGLVLGEYNLGILRDLWCDDSQHCLDARTKCTGGGKTFNIHIVRTNQAIFLLKGGDGVHGGQLNQKCHETIKYLKDQGY